MISNYDPMPSGFHDTSLVGASHEGSTICLNVEYYTEDDTEASMKAVIQGVEEVIRDDNPIPEFAMETEYASIIMLERKGQDIVLLLNWINFPSKVDTTRFYCIIGSDVRLLLDFG